MTWRAIFALSLACIELVALVVGGVLLIGRGEGQPFVLGSFMGPAVAGETTPGLGFAPAAQALKPEAEGSGASPAIGSDAISESFSRPEAVSVFSFAETPSPQTEPSPSTGLSPVDDTAQLALETPGTVDVPPAGSTVVPSPSSSKQASDPEPAVAAAPEGSAVTPLPAVDETALRYFARQGDARRLEAEIARLRALYPNWTPPADPMQVPDIGDAQLDRMWQLYSAGKYAEVRAAIAERQQSEPTWQPPADLLDRLGVAEARIRLVNGSNLQQYETVIRIATQTPSLLTCSEVDVLWRLARAFVETKKPARALDAYVYILTNCENSGERLATIQMAVAQLSRPALDTLLALERTGPDGVGEFASVRADLARRSVDAAGEDASVSASQGDLDIVRRLASDGGKASDMRLLGWYYLRRQDPATAGDWFAKAHAVEDSPESSQGLALSLLAQSKPVDAEAIMRRWSDESEASRKVYVAAAANILAIEPPLVQTPEVLQAIVTAVVKLRDADAARQLGWYSYGLNQFAPAGQWFALALQWKSGDEAAAFGLALTRQRLGDSRGLTQLQAAWDGLSPRIAAIGTPGQATSSAASTVRQIVQNAPAVIPQTADSPAIRQPGSEPSAPEVQPLAYSGSASSPQVAQVATAPARTERRVAKAASSRRGKCSGNVDPQSLSGRAVLDLGWCLLDLDRPLEAVPAFERAMSASAADVRRDAAYGQSLAYLRVGLADKAAVASTREPQPKQRRIELQTALLTAQAVSSLDAKRPVETLMALEQRSRIAPDRLDLMILRGYAYFDLGRLSDAEKMFTAAAKAGSSEGARGINVVREANRTYVPSN